MMRANELGSGEDHRGAKALADDIMALETASEHLVKRIPIGRGDECVGAVLARLSGQAFDAVDVVYIVIVDDLGGLQGHVPLPKLLVMPQDRRLRDVIIVRPPTVNPDEDQEHVVGLAVEHHLTAIPVVDPLGRLLGVVPAQALMGDPPARAHRGSASACRDSAGERPGPPCHRSPADAASA
jgi:CBS domain-containing protein